MNPRYRHPVVPALLASLLLTTVVYWIGLHGPLLFDDRPNLLPVAAWLEGRTDAASVIFGNTSGRFGRPLSMLGFMLNAALLGPGVWGLKLGNLLVHLVNGALVFALFRTFVRCGALTRSGTGTAWIPWLGASIWLLHPLLVSTVLYVVQRMAMLSALFTLLALIAYVHGRLALRQRRRGSMLLLGVAVPICTALATLSKENGVLVPALCGVVEWFAFQPAAGARRSWPSRLFIGATLMLPAAIAPALVLSGSPLLTGYENRPFSMGERMLTEPRALWTYVGALLLPNGPQMGIYHDDYLISRGWLEPPTTALALAAWAAVLAAGWRLRRPVPGLALGVGLFLAGHALESSVFPLLPYFEHRNYLPAIGLIWAVLGLLSAASERLRWRIGNAPALSAAGAVALVLTLSLSTAARAGVWASHRAIMQQALHHHPNSRWLRQDLIAEAMGRQPPDLASARAHADHLLASAEPSTRRIGAIERILVGCSDGAKLDPAIQHTAYEGQPEPIEPDLLAVFELLGNRVRNGACPGLAPKDAAVHLAELLDRSQLESKNAMLRSLRLEAAKLFAAADNSEYALIQARLALPQGTIDAKIESFIAELSTQQSDSAPRDGAMNHTQ